MFAHLLPPLNEHNLPYPDTIHLIVVHFVIAMVLFAFLCDIIGYFVKNTRLYEVSWWNNGEPFAPQTNDAIGGNTKIYGAALMRMRERDFEAVNHHDGISPAWDIKYSNFEPYYTESRRTQKFMAKRQMTRPNPSEAQIILTLPSIMIFKFKKLSRRSQNKAFIQPHYP